MKKSVLYVSLLVLLIIVIGVVGFFAYQKTKDKAKNVAQTLDNSDQGKVQGQSTKNYFDDNAKVMFFYSDLCSWCKKEEAVLEELAPAGYRVKPMNVKDHPDYWQTYSISGTPTFITSDGTKKVGYQDKDALKTFLDKYK